MIETDSPEHRYARFGHANKNEIPKAIRRTSEPIETEVGELAENEQVRIEV
jgi:hypothetical protein